MNTTTRVCALRFLLLGASVCVEAFTNLETGNCLGSVVSCLLFRPQAARVGFVSPTPRCVARRVKASLSTSICSTKGRCGRLQKLSASPSKSEPINCDQQQNESLSAATTREERDFIEKALLKNAMFTSLSELSLLALIESFERTTAIRDEIIIRQGDSCEGDYAYLIGEGECTVIVNDKVVPEPYGTLRPMSIFGELGVLDNATRAATIAAKSDEVTLFRVDGDTFKNILVSVTSSVDAEELEKIDEAIQQISGTRTFYEGNIIRPYKPDRLWLWAQWSGTILQHNFQSTLGNMLGSLLFVLSVRHFMDDTTPFFSPPDQEDPVIVQLEVIHKLWNYQMGLTTFILSFFVDQAYRFWQDIHSISRRMQSSLDNFHMLLATSAKRNKDGTYTARSESLLEDVGASSRLYHALFWASCARRFKVLQTPRGLQRMAGRGLMTSKQLEVLQSLDLPENQKYNACIEWMMVLCWEGLEDGTLRGSGSLDEQILEELCSLRSSSANVKDTLSCRMPLAYTHFVQILVDSFVVLSPVALYSELGAYSVVGVGLLSLFYAGLLDLAKVFLDPLDNEDFCDDNSITMDLGVLIREKNAGSTRWRKAGSRLPF